MIDVVDENTIGYFQNLPVHPDDLAMCSIRNGPPGIEGMFAGSSVPFVLAQSLVVFGVDDGVFALCEWYAAKRVAVADAAVEQDESHERPCQPVRNRYGKIEFDTQPPELVN